MKTLRDAVGDVVVELVSGGTGAAYEVELADYGLDTEIWKHASVRILARHSSAGAAASAAAFTPTVQAALGTVRVTHGSAHTSGDVFTLLLSLRPLRQTGAAPA